MTSTAVCDHGYNTELPDGTDPYREAMNIVMRNVFTLTQSLPTIWTHEHVNQRIEETYFKIKEEVQRQGCWDTTLLRKVIATASNTAKTLGQQTSHSAAKHQQSEQLMVFSKIVTQLEFESTNVVLPKQDRPSCDRDLSLYILRRVPCTCYDDLKRQLNALRRTDMCTYESCRKIKRFARLEDCGRCRMASYCSVDCQAKDWPRHKIDCKKIQKLDVEIGDYLEKRDAK